MTISAVHHIAVICSDYGKSPAFCLDVLGMEVKSRAFRWLRNVLFPKRRK